MHGVVIFEIYFDIHGFLPKIYTDFIKNVLQNVLKQCDNAERSFFYLKEISRKIQTHASRLGGNSILNKKNVFFFFLHSLFHLKCFVKSVEKQTLRRKSFP